MEYKSDNWKFNWEIFDRILDFIHKICNFIHPILQVIDTLVPERIPPTLIEKGTIRAQKVSEVCSTMAILVRVIEKLSRLFKEKENTLM